MINPSRLVALRRILALLDGLPSLAALIIRLVAVVCCRPRELPATGHIL